MAHWAEINEESIVTRVLVGDNNDPAGDEGYSWLIENLGGTWIKTSYNSFGGKHYTEEIIEYKPKPDETITLRNKVESGQPHLRYNYAGVGFLYDPVRDAFIPPKPHESWILNEETCLWDAPVEYPNDGKTYFWNENVLNWQEVEQP